MPVTDSFAAFVLEQLDEVGPITSKRMFGGVGLYAGDLFFALLWRDVLYLKADDSTRAARRRAGARPFQPYPNRARGGGTMQYYSVPAAILEDGDAVIAWARESVAIARAQRANPPKRRKGIKPKPPRKGARPVVVSKPRRRRNRGERRDR